MKSKRSEISAPLFVAVILMLIPISEKLLLLTVKSDSNIILSAGIVQLFIFAIPTAFYCKINRTSLMQQSKIQLPAMRDLPFVLSAALTYLFSSIILLYLQSSFFSGSSSETALIQSATYDSFAMAMTYVFIPAIVEELFFRSILISDYSEYGGVTAVTVSALFFAMLHFSFGQFFLYFVLGAILALITYVTGSSVPAVIIHIINNTAVIFFGGSINVFLRESSSSIILVFILTVAFLGSLAAMLSSMEALYERRSELYEEGKLPGSRIDMADKTVRAGRMTKNIKRKRRKAAIFLSPTFFLCVMLFIFITLEII